MSSDYRNLFPQRSQGLHSKLKIDDRAGLRLEPPLQGLSLQLSATVALGIASRAGAAVQSTCITLGCAVHKLLSSLAHLASVSLPYQVISYII